MRKDTRRRAERASSRKEASKEEGSENKYEIIEQSFGTTYFLGYGLIILWVVFLLIVATFSKVRHFVASMVGI